MDYHNYSQNTYRITCNRNSPILVVTAHFIKVWICLDFIISITHVVAKGGVPTCRKLMARLFFFFTFCLLLSGVLGYTQNSSALNFDNEVDAWESEDSELNQIHVLPCVPLNSSVKQFKTDVLIVKRNFTECSGHDSQYNNAVSTILSH